MHHAGRQYAVGLAEAQAAPEGAGAGGILAQRKLLDANRQHGLLQLERNDAGVAMRHGAERAGAIVGRARAPAAMPAVMGAEKCAVGAPAVEADARMGPEMAARHALRQRLLQCPDHSIDHGRERGRVVAHGGGRRRAQDRSRRQDELERPERSFVRHLARPDEIFEGDARGGLAAAEIAGIDRALRLAGHPRIVDRHLVAPHDDRDADGQRLLARAVVVEKGFGRVDAVRHGADEGACGRLRLVEDQRDGAGERRHAVFAGELRRQVASQEAAGELRRDVAHELDRLAGIVLDDAIDLLDRLALRPQLDRTQLQAFHEDVGRARHRSADIDPVHIDGEEADQGVALGPDMDGRVHDGVVEVLALHRRVVAEHHVAGVKPLAPVDLQSVAHRHADRVGDERRHAAGALRDQLSVGVGEPDREVVVLVDIGAERGALDVGVDLVGDRHQAMPDHFERDRVDGEPRILMAGKVLHRGRKDRLRRGVCLIGLVGSAATRS